MIYLEDSFLDHPKMIAIGDEGVMMWLRGLKWLKEQRSTDGRIPKVVVPRLAPVIKCRALPTGPIVERLIAAGTWHDEGDAVVVHGYVERNEASIHRSEVGRENARKRWDKRKGSTRTDAPPPSQDDATALPLQMPPQSNGKSEPNGSGNAYSPQSTVHSPQGVSVDTPSLATESVGADPGQGGSGYAEAPTDDPDDDGETLAERHQSHATGDEEPPGLRQVDALLRKVCPPKLNRLFGAPRSDLRIALRKGADLELILAAIRQGEVGEGATLRWQRAAQALADGRLPTGGGVPARPFEAPAWVDERPPDPGVVAEELAKARAALTRGGG